ncbi:Ig-like domain-containing protein [Massilia sp. B-10]|nr:Ig-like domain-containing protein [Massilia sp. B-10]
MIQAKAPVALADTVSATANQEMTLNVLANDSHPDKLALELVSVGAAAHGSAALKNGALVYTRAWAGYYGPDKISYTIRAVGGTVSATGEASVSVGMPLRLSGKIGLRDGLSSIVTVKVGTRSFTQTLINERQYDLPVVLEAPEQMVSITAQATNADVKHVKMITLAGDARTLLAASGGSGSLHDRQWADLNVSLVSSGKYGALRDANGGVV